MGPAQIYSLLIARNNQPLIFDKAHTTGFMTTYSADNTITDSAAAGTALACGQKTNNTMLGILPDGTHLKSLISYAHDNEWKTGLIVTCDLTHATPAAFYAHVYDRYYNNEITDDLLKSGIDILIGGGINHIDDADYLSTIHQQFIEKGYDILNDAAQIKATESDKYTLFMADKGLLPTITQGRDELLMPNITEDVLNKLSDDNFFIMIEGSQKIGRASCRERVYVLV